jgi:hypothetical protein
MRQSFVLAASRVAATTRTRTTQSKIASLAGVSRLEARKILARAGTERSQVRPTTRINQLIAGWKSDPDFAARGSKPRPLGHRGSHSEFDALVRRYGRDVTKKTLLDQLVSLGMANLKNGRVHLNHGTKLSKHAIAATADLRFVASQLKNIEFELGRRAYQTRSIFIEARDKKSVQTMKQIAFNRLETVLSSLTSLSATPRQRASKRSAQHRLLVSTTVAVESEDSP